jgi:hypothetical protein
LITGRDFITGSRSLERRSRHYPEACLIPTLHVFPTMLSDNDANSVGRDDEARAKADPQPLDRLSALPDELLHRIFDVIGRTGRKRDLGAVSRLNRRVHALADLVLYKDMLFYDPGHHVIFCQGLDRRPRRGSLIENLTLMYGFDDKAAPNVEPDVSDSSSSSSEELALDTRDHHQPHHHHDHHVHVTLSAMSNLTTLDVAVPASLAPVFGRLFNGPFDLAHLKHCTLEYQCPGKGKYWDLQSNIHIFAHPTVETLVLRRARLPDIAFRDHMEKPREMTPLRKLHLVDCDINDDGLSDVLACPVALEEFVMVHSHHHADDDDDDDSEKEVKLNELEESADNVGYYIIALEAQQKSLQSVTIDMAMLSGRRALRMREFTALHTLRLSWDYQLFGQTNKKKPRLHSVGLPPNLQTLEFFRGLGEDDEVTELLEHVVLNRALLAEKWDRLVVPEGDDMGVLRRMRKASREAGLEFTVIGEDDDEDEEG